MGILDDLFRQIGDFLGGSSKSDAKSVSENAKNVASNIGRTDGMSASNGTLSSNIQSLSSKELLNQRYSTIDTQNKIKGVLFDKLINNANEIIGDANKKKANTKIK